MSEFPEELIERCAKKLEQYGPQYSAKEKVWAILRESGHAELVAALKKIVNASPAYLAEEISGDEFINIVLEATDNQEINPVLRKIGIL